MNANLEIIEGHVHLDVEIGDAHEQLTMAPVPVKVHWATDCPAYDVDDDNVPTGPPKPMRGYEHGSHYIHHGVRCDCNHWPVIRIDRA